MNDIKYTFCIIILLLISGCERSVFSNEAAYAEQIIGIPPPKPIREISSIRRGDNAPLVRWKMDESTFKQYKNALSSSGFKNWSIASYDLNDPSSFVDKIVFAGFAKGNGAKVVVGEKITQKGKSSIHVYYDIASEEFIAIKGYGASRMPLN